MLSAFFSKTCYKYIKRIKLKGHSFLSICLLIDVNACNFSSRKKQTSFICLNPLYSDRIYLKSIKENLNEIYFICNKKCRIYFSYKMLYYSITFIIHNKIHIADFFSYPDYFYQTVLSETKLIKLILEIPIPKSSAVSCTKELGSLKKKEEEIFLIIFIP